MQRKRIVVGLGKIVLAGCFALIILNLLTCVYRGGLPAIADETMATHARGVPNTYFSKITEGICIGVYDQNGFNNAYPAKSDVDYLCLGSSHMEAMQVMPNRNMVYDLNELLDANERNEYAYNIGVWAERLPECINRLGYAIEAYHPQKAIIIETAILDFSQEEVDGALGQTEEGGLRYSFSGGIMGFVRKLPYVRLAYIQLEALVSRKAAEPNDATEVDVGPSFDRVAYTRRMTPLLQKAVENAGGLPVIILYHPGVTIRPDGAMDTNGDQAMIRQFQQICEDNGLFFLDMSDRFAREYKENYTVPYGFANTSAGNGHLNNYGHAMIADELYQLISEVA